MKCNPEKINSFFSSDKFDKDVKKLVMKLLEGLCDSDADTQSKIAFVSLGFYEVEDGDEDDSCDCRVIDFYRLDNFTPQFKKFVIKLILRMIKDDGKGAVGDFFESFLIDDLKIVVPYDEWKKTNRKNKLTELNNK